MSEYRNTDNSTKLLIPTVEFTRQTQELFNGVKPTVDVVQQFGMNVNSLNSDWCLTVSSPVVFVKVLYYLIKVSSARQR